jgi:hypothetical protein
MGLLDDAIREHLELKRRRGADPDEVARQENEALGAARRAEFARPEGGEAAAEAGDVPVPAEPPAGPFDAGADAPFADEPSEPAAPRHDPFAPSPPEPDEPAAPEEPAAAAPDEPFAAEEPVVEAEEPVVAAEEPVVEAEEPLEAGDEREPFDIEAVEGGDAPPEAPTRRHEWLEDEPDEVPADEALDHPRQAEPAEGEDVLEETPDFLQETPEHDRLWFEQRPPRDFDWDK